MKKEFTEEELRRLGNDINQALGMMGHLKRDHSSAKVTFDLDTRRVSVTYPVTKDGKKVHEFLKETGAILSPSHLT